LFDFLANFVKVGESFIYVKELPPLCRR
jgi:hypothetical protein